MALAHIRRRVWGANPSSFASRWDRPQEYGIPNQFGLCLTNSHGGVLDLGFADQHKYTGALQWVPMSQQRWYNMHMRVRWSILAPPSPSATHAAAPSLTKRGAACRTSRSAALASAFPSLCTSTSTIKSERSSTGRRPPLLRAPLLTHGSAELRPSCSPPPSFRCSRRSTRARRAPSRARHAIVRALTPSPRVVLLAANGVRQPEHLLGRLYPGRRHGLAARAGGLCLRATAAQACTPLTHATRGLVLFSSQRCSSCSAAPTET
jgi:hypothetical protein